MFQPWLCRLYAEDPTRLVRSRQRPSAHGAWITKIGWREPCTVYPGKSSTIPSNSSNENAFKLSVDPLPC